MSYNLCDCGNRKGSPAARCRMCQMSETNRNEDISSAEVAWVAGILEGEGCWTGSGNKWRIAVRMTDVDIIERLHTLTGVGTIGKSEAPKPKHRQCYYWFVTKDIDKLWLTNLVLPWLGVRRSAKIATLCGINIDGDVSDFQSE